LDRIIHKSHIIVDQRGTLASNPAIEKCKEKKMPMKKVDADHPFMFVIMDQITGVILFEGLFSDPERTLEVGYDHELDPRQVKWLVDASGILKK